MTDRHYKALSAALLTLWVAMVLALAATWQPDPTPDRVLPERFGVREVYP